MFLYLSKLLPLFVYPLGLACLLLVAALILRRYRSWQTAAIVAALLVLWLGGNRFVSMALIQSLERQHPPATEIPDTEMIVVLGGATRSPSWPRQFVEVNEGADRLIHAARLYAQGVAPTMILSGGKPPWSGANAITEAESMARILGLMGVPRDAMVLETVSRNTYENAVETRKLLEPLGITRIALVTSAMHMPRAVRIFQKQGFDVLAAPADFLVSDDDWRYYTQPSAGIQLMNLIPSADDLAYTSKVIREYVGTVMYSMRGWL